MGGWATRLNDSALQGNSSDDGNNKSDEHRVGLLERADVGLGGLRGGAGGRRSHARAGAGGRSGRDHGGGHGAGAGSSVR